jgi:tetratricopeptide (TPR) repeat protein
MKRLLFCLVPVLFFAACNKNPKANLTPRQAAVSKIDSIETQIKASINRQENPNVQLAMNAIKHYKYFAHDFPKDTLSPQYLFKAAQIYEGVLQDHEEAAEIYGETYEKYPEFRNRPMMLFHQGNAFIEAGDTAHAAMYLNKFIVTYTDHPFADDAQGLLRMMRMNEQQFQEFLHKGDQKAEKPQPEAKKQ